MCYHVASLVNSTQELSEQLGIPELNPGKNAKNYQMAYHLNGFDYPWLPVIHAGSSGERLDTFRWGLVPEWAQSRANWSANTLNARNDELFDKPSYRDYWENRCLVVVSGFFEPRAQTIQGLFGEEIPKNAKTESWYIHPAETAYFTLGGIYYNDTVSIITTEATPLMASVHNQGMRMPLILDQENLKEKWLSRDINQEEMAQLMLNQPDDEQLTAFRTIDGVMNSRVNTNVPEVVRALK